MASWKHELADPPAEPRARELWLQHAAGFILCEDVRRYALDQIDPDLPPEARAAAQKGIDDALYGLMMVIDGVSGRLANQNHTVTLDFIARLTSKDAADPDHAPLTVDLREGDGMCMGYHGWIDGDFGDDRLLSTQPGD